MTPASFNGTPPDLPPASPKAPPVDLANLPPLPIHAGTYANYSRLVFEWPRAVKYTAFPSAGHLTLRFAVLATPDFSALERIAPPWVKHGGWRVEGGATVIEFTTDSGSRTQITRDGTKLVLDVLAPTTDAAKAGTAAPGISPAQKQAVLAAANQVNGTAQASVPNGTAPQPTKPAPQAANAATGAPTNLLAAAAITPPAPAAASPAGASATRTPDGVTVNFPGGRTVAAFIRANTAWMVVEGGHPIDVATLQAQLGDFPASVEGTMSGAAIVLRIGLKQPEQIGAALAGDHLAVTLGPHIGAAVAPLPMVRNDDDPRYSALASVVPGSAHALSLADPEVGDTLVIVPSQPGNGVRTLRSYLEFAALPSAAGLVLAPAADDLDVTVAQSRVSISRPGGLALTPPAVAIPTSPAAFAGAGAGSSNTFLDLAGWRKGPGASFFASQQKLRAQSAAANATEAFHGRLALARFYIANGFGAEALGLVRLMQSSDPALESDAQLQMIRAAAEYMMGRYHEARSDLSDPALANDRHAALWRGLTEAALEDWPAARGALAQAAPVLALYPAEWHERGQLARIAALAETGDLETATREMTKVPAEVAPPIAQQAQLVQAMLLARTGHGSDADGLFAAVESSGDERAAASALYEHTLCDLADRRISQQAATDNLEALRFRWRGDALELTTLRKLGALYFARNDWRHGLQTLHIASQEFAADEQGHAAEDDMRAAFEQLFLKGRADKLPPIQALAVFYDFIELTPIGPKGDEMIRRMADRLIAVDLLSPAAKLLKYQVDNRLDGVARAQVATRLATLDLLDHKPKDAIEALRTTRISGLPDAVNHQRMLLEARALAELKQWDQALDIIAVDASADSKNLRAEIYWESGNWQQAGANSEALISSAAAGEQALSQSDRQNLMRAAIAYSLAGDQPSLNRLRTRFGAKLQGSTDASAFSVITENTDPQGPAFRDVAARLASVDTLQAFMADFRKRPPTN